MPTQGPPISATLLVVDDLRRRTINGVCGTSSARATIVNACRPQRDMHETALKLVANNFTLFFDLNTDGKHADYLHTIVMLSEPRGNSDYFDTMMPGAHPFVLSTLLLCSIYVATARYYTTLMPTMPSAPTFLNYLRFFFVLSPRLLLCSIYVAKVTTITRLL